MDKDDISPPSSPSPKRGAYNIDFDAIDENTNPFATKSKIGMSSSPPINSSFSQGAFDDSENPFKPRKALANSPPSSPKPSPNVNKTTHSSDCENINNFNKADAVSFDNDNFSNNVVEDNASEDKSRPQTIPKKKKTVKKTQVQSKFKPPANFSKDQDDTAEIKIFMPGIHQENNNEESKPHKNTEESIEKTMKEFPAGTEEEEVPPLDAAPEAMASSLEADQRFVEGEKGDDEPANEGFAAPQEEFKDANDWELLNSSANNVDKQGEDKGISEDIDGNERRVKTSREGVEHRRKSSDNAHLSQTPPPQSESPEGSRTKHPAVRALEAAQTEGLAPGHGKTIPTTMEKGLEDGHVDQNKGTVVQLVQVLRYSQSDWNKMKQELELNYQTSLLNKERDWSLMLADRDKKIANLNDTSKKLKATNEDMRMVVAEFEKTISQLQADKEKSKSESHKTVHDLEQERDQALEDLQSVETAFSDLHRRYEKSKSIIEGFKRNEEQLKGCVDDLQGKLRKSEMKMQSLRSQAEEKLDKANEDIEKIKKSTRSEVVRLEAALKKAELRISSLEESLQRKEKENQELTAICDELISKVGS